MSSAKMSEGMDITTSATRVGGLLADFPDGWIEDLSHFLDTFPKTLDEVHRLLTGNGILLGRTRVEPAAHGRQVSVRIDRRVCFDRLLVFPHVARLPITAGTQLLPRRRTFERVDEPLRNDAGKMRRSALREARLPRQR